MNEEMKTTILSIPPKPETLLLRDGTSFTRTPTGAYDGDPTPGQVLEIQGHLSDHARIGLVRTCKAGELQKFYIDFFLRET